MDLRRPHVFIFMSLFILMFVFMITSKAQASSLTIIWTASTDNVGVAGYKVYRCQGSSCTPSVLIASTYSTSYTDSNLPPSTAYTYAVSAYDAAGNESAKSAPMTAMTPSNSSTNTITVRAKGSFAGGGWPIMEIWVDGSTKINSVTVASSIYQDYTFTFNGSILSSVDVVFVNDYYNSQTGEDRNLYVDYIIVNGQKYEAESPSTKYDRFSPFDGKDVINGQEAMWWSGALRFNIGLSAQADTIPPSTPTGLKVLSVSSSSITISWVASTDNIGVAGYQIFRNNVLISTTTGTNYKDSGLLPSTSYSYTVVSYDASGNNSLPSNPIFVRTLAKNKGWYSR